MSWPGNACATTAEGTKLGGTVHRQKRSRTVALTATSVALAGLTTDVVARVEALTGTTGWQIAIDPTSPLRVRLDRHGVPRALRGTLRIHGVDGSAAVVGRLTLALERR
jgi:hypothetical protein